jgi:hypothetical protein
MVSSRLHLGNQPFQFEVSWQRTFPWLYFWRDFPWILSFTCFATLTFGGVAFVFILQGAHGESSRVLVVAAVITAHGFLACFSLRRIHTGALDYRRLFISSCILSFNLASLPLSVLALLCSGITTRGPCSSLAGSLKQTHVTQPTTINFASTIDF